MDVLSIVIIGIVSIILIGLGIFILSGWGDSLIAGYNTASKEEQQKYNIKRLRLVVALILFIVPVVISIPLFLGKEDSSIAHILTTIVFFIIVIVGVILGNTWCKKQ
ncbi:MAG: DUF3784 domain-containing protein [Muribaculaceae bacterium]|nr:DUF3784 domain-containing protein [Muribaculaceae bacterium]